MRLHETRPVLQLGFVLVVRSAPELDVAGVVTTLKSLHSLVVAVSLATRQ